MSYSRWGYRGSGHWYTFWAAQIIEENETYDNAELVICLICSFCAKELRDNIDRCILTVSSIDPKATPEELDELRVYMGEFLNDVDQEYKKEATA